MRPSLLALLIVAAGAAAADDPPPIPQDPKAIANYYPDMLAYNRATLGGAYDRVGRRDPKWDAPARAALDALAREFSHDRDPANPPPKPGPLAAEAIKLGCDDPMVLYAHARSAQPAAERESLLRAATAALAASDYPPNRKAWAAAKLAEALAINPTPDRKAEAIRHVDAVLALLPAVATHGAGRPVGRDEPLTLAIEASRLLARLGEPRAALHQRVDAALAADPAVKPTRLILLGNYLTTHAWEARGGGLAGTVTADGWKLFGERLTAARAALEEAWRLAPHTMAAEFMITVEMGSGGGDRAAMEKWFTRAMEQNPYNAQACRKKLQWLQPKWHGSERAVLEFADQCWATNNVRAGIPLVFAEAHDTLARPLDTEGRKEYYSAPKLSDAIQEVYAAHFTQFPDDRGERARYAAYCFLGGRTTEAVEQFKLAGDAVEQAGDKAIFSKAWLVWARNAAGAKLDAEKAKP